jgi:hypothetical protein
MSIISGWTGSRRVSSKARRESCAIQWGVLLHAQQGAFSMFTEADFQFGSFGTDNIRAWKYAQSLSWSFRDRPLRPVVSLLGGFPAATPARPPMFSGPSIPCFRAASIIGTSIQPAP